MTVPPRLYPRWIRANALGEFVGLGGTFLIAAALLPTVSRIDGLGGVLASFVVLVAAGAFEASVLAGLQHRVMHPYFPQVSRLAWWRATLIGALIAYLLGYLPSTLMGAAEATGAEPIEEPALWLVLLLAAALGAVAGVVLSSFQAAVLRTSVHGARRWIAANMAAWAVGMPILFAGMDVAFRRASLLAIVATIAVSLVVAGGAVGAIHGRTLLRFSEEAASSPD